MLLIGPVDKIEKEMFFEAISSPEIKNSIIHYEWKDISLLPSFISVSDICLSPIVKNDQHESGVANKIFQYMLFERPLIVSNCKPQAIIVEEEQCGVVFNSEDSVDLSEKIIELYKNKELRIAMGKNGKKAVIEKYNTNVVGQHIIYAHNN